jgi:molybdopterin synthase sulfur carrier subunit
MNVHFYATLRAIVGQKTVEFQHRDGITLRELINEILATYPLLRRELIDEHGDFYRHVHILVNGRDMPYLENALDTTLLPDDAVSMFPAVGGGADCSLTS